MRLRVLLGLLLVALAAGCSSSPPTSNDSLPDDAVITYAYHDASVPPAYHRSVTLSITKEQAQIVVDSYGDVLADEVLPTSPAAWGALSSSIGALSGIDLVEPASGCVGGTGIDLHVSSGREDLVDISAAFCGGSNAAAEKALTSWVAPVRTLFPSTDVLAPS